MALSAGEKLGPYEIVAPLGKGGMGEVWRAKDTRLNRDVAVKVSSQQFSERFEREARVIASLNHPNICQLYDVGPNYLVMELIEGPTLADRITSGAIPLEEALNIARQIAAALGAAHEKGVVHRDLKPANVKITPDGAVKVLDFGLAKVSPESSGELSQNSPTITIGATQAGMILGTAAYMAPEQARGRNADKRADIWAFGVVLYEMLTGHRLFEGEDLTDTLAAVVRHNPDLSTAPARVKRLLEKCLEKDPAKRLRDIGDMELLLEEPEATAAPAPPAPSRSRFGWMAGMAAGIALVALAGISFIHFGESAPAEQAVKFTLAPPPQTDFIDLYGGFAVSPDGKYVLLSAAGKARRTLWLRSLDSLEARELPGTDGGNFPTWSPDSKSVVFSDGSRLKRLDLAGGTPLTLCETVNSSAVSPTGTWNRDGVILFGSSLGIQRVSASGGGATGLTKLTDKEINHGYPEFLPDGNHFLYFVQSSDLNAEGVYASSLKDPASRKLIVRTTAKGVYVPPKGTGPGYLLYLQDQTLLARRFDPVSLELSGDSVLVAESIGRYSGAPVRSAFWASDSGLLIYFPEPQGQKVFVSWLGRDGKKLGEAFPEESVNTIALAPGGERMSLERMEPGRPNWDIWIREFKTGITTRLTFDSSLDSAPVWSPDGKTIAYSSTRDGIAQIYRKQASGAGAEEQLTAGGNPKLALDWSRDGKYLLYSDNNPVTRRDLFVLPLEGDRKPMVVANSKFAESAGAFSPDGKWIAYASNDSGRDEVYVQAFPGQGPAGRWQVSNGGGFDVRWRGDGKELFYEAMDAPARVMSVAIQTGPQGVRAEPPKELFRADFNLGQRRKFEVTPDGQRFLLILNNGDSGSAPLTVVSNWQAGLKK